MHTKTSNGTHLTEQRKDLSRIVCIGCTEVFFVHTYRERHLTWCPFCGEKFNGKKTEKT